MTSFADGQAQLAERSPDLLITHVRLGAFNGLHLVIQRDHRGPSIVMDTHSDLVLEGEAQRLGAFYVTTPLSPTKALFK